LYSYGVNVITTGNHLWDQKEITSYIDKDQNLLKPYNFAEGSPGLGFNIYELANKEKIAVINIMGNLFMRSCDNAFFKIEEVLQKIDVNDLSFIFVDFHAEASSEKMAMGHHLDGRVTAVVGTHTHVPTADANIMEHGTAYQTDAGMCGDYDSVIGTKKQEFVRKFATQDTERKRVPPADGIGTLCGVIIESQDNNFLAKNIQSIRIGGKIGS
jgi:metallophosphoesterase (TIGR00282 family)